MNAKRLRLLLLLLPLVGGSALAQDAQTSAKEEKPLTGWFASAGFRVGYEGQNGHGVLGVGVGADFGKNLKGQPLALGARFNYDVNRSWASETQGAEYSHRVSARPFLRTYVFARGPVGASFDTSIPVSYARSAQGAESLTVGVEMSPTVVYFVNTRMTVFMTLSLFELSYNCTVPLADAAAPVSHRFVAGFLNLGPMAAVMGITWNL